MRFAPIAAAAMICAAPAYAQVASQQQVAVTIYNNNLSLVEDVRSVSPSAGRSRLEFPGVSANIQAETVALAAEGIEIIEQNFDFDLLTPSKMMEKAVGEKVRIVRTNPATGQQVTETAEVLSANQGVVLRIGDRIEVLRDDGLPVRVLFDKIPENLRAKPTLSVEVQSRAGGKRPATLRYLTGGLGWNADYVGLFDERSGELSLQGWVTLTNTSGTSYPNAKVQLIAGSPGDGGPRPVRNVRRGGMGGDGGDETSFADYHLYTLPEATTIAENQTKQVSFIDADRVKAQKIYKVERSGFGSEEFATGAAVRVAFQNARDSGLGAALPAGTMRLYAKDKSGKAQFIGEDNLGHTAEGADIDLAVGQAFDVTAQATMERRETPSEGVTVTQMLYTFRNARAEPLTIQFRQNGISGDHDIQRSTFEPRKINANTYAWTVQVPARGETKLDFTVREGKRR
jgi:hypothetical protein